MAHNVTASWAETVPDLGLMTVDQLLALPDDGCTYELVEGRLVRMPPSGGGASRRAMRLGSALTVFVETHGLGVVTGADGGYVLSRPGEPPTSLAPDVAFVRTGRYPAEGTADYEAPWHVAPDLVVEIASPNQYRPEMAQKARLYLASGVPLIWIVWPKYQQIDVWRPGSDQPIATLSGGDRLDGMEVVPGFTYPVAQIFP